MKITAIELSEIELSAIINELTSKFNTEDKRQSIDFMLCEVREFEGFNHFENVSDLFLCNSELELYTEYPERDENNQTAISYRSVLKFLITFFYDGEEIQVNSDQIYEAINKYYEI